MRLYSKRLLLTAGGIFSVLTLSAQIVAQCSYFSAFESGGFLPQAGSRWSTFPGRDPAKADALFDSGIRIRPITDSTGTDIVYSLNPNETGLSFGSRIPPEAILTVAFSDEASLGEREAYILSVGSADLVNHLRRGSSLGFFYRITDTGIDTLLSFDVPTGFVDVSIDRSGTGTKIDIGDGSEPITNDLRVPEDLDRVNFYSVGPEGTYDVASFCPEGVVGIKSPFRSASVNSYTYRSGQTLPARYVRRSLKVYDANGRQLPGANRSLDLATGIYYAVFESDETSVRERWIIVP